MEQTIVALSGRKQSGKNTAANFITEWYMENNPSIDTGQLHTGGYKDSYYANILKRNVFECSFADNLKGFCMNTLGLSHESCYGTEEEKNAPTQYSWENCSAYFRWKFGTKEVEYPDGSIARCGHIDEANLTAFFYNPNHYPFGHKEGSMSGREIMQLFGTDLIRYSFGNVWAKATIRHIKKNGKSLNIITDNRFPNEVEEVLKEENAYIIRLTRSPQGREDEHPSEAALDDYDWNKERCIVLDNSEMNIEEQNKATVPILENIFGFTS